MNWIKRIAFFGLALFVMMGTAGFYVFEHSCKVDGSDAHLYLAKQHVCSDEMEVESCCHSPSKDQQEKDCCEDEVKVFQTEYDYFHNIDHPEFVDDLNCTCHIPCFAFDVREADLFTQMLPNGPPYVLSGRSLGVQYQVFRC